MPTVFKMLPLSRYDAVGKKLILIGGVIAIYSRYPLFFLEPRFWAEEGSVYFAYAYSHPWYDSLLALHQGYYSLFPNVSAILANLVPLRDAPVVTTLFAFMVQMMPLLIVIYGKGGLWDTTFRKLVAVLIILFTPISAEIWLNTTNSQFFFSLITFLILMEDDANGFRRKFYGILLCISGLTGVVSCFFLPLFLLKAWKTKKSAYYMQTWILSFCAGIQILAVLASTHGTSPERFVTTSLPVILSIIWTKTIVLPFAGLNWANTFAFKMAMMHFFDSQGFAVFGYALLFLLLLFLFLVFQGKEPFGQLLILGSYFVITLLSIFGSLGDKARYIDAFFGGRYFYVPSVILMVFIYSGIDFTNGAVRMARSTLCVLLIAASLVTGAIVYRPSIRFVAHENWPRWSEEVERWEKDKSYAPKIWPQNENSPWVIELDRASNSK
jgi:hypothetical protein